MPTKQEQFEIWKSRISHKRTEMDTLDSLKGWTRYKKFYRNEYKDALGLDPKIPTVTINDVYSFVRTSVSSLYAREPRIRVNPVRKQDLVVSHVLEQAVNHYWYHKRIKRQIKKAIKEGKLVGYSWVIVGFEADIEQVNGVEAEPNEFVKDEDLFVIHERHDKIWYDSDAQDPPYDCRWMVHVYTKPTEYLRKKYKNEKIQATREMKNPGSLSEDDKERTDVYEIWDKDSGKIKFYIEGLDDFVEEKSWMSAYIDKKGRYEFPFVMLCFDEYIDLGEDNNLPDPEIRAFEPQILENMKLRSMQMEHIKRYNRQMFIDKGKLVDENQMENIKNGDIAALVEVNGDPNTVAAPMPYPPIQMDIYAVGNLIAVDKDQISGQSSLERGAAAQTKTRTLGEIEQISEGTKGRSAEQQGIVEDFTVEITRKMIKIMQKNFDVKKIVNISGTIPMPVVSYLESKGNFDGFSIGFTKEDIQGDVDVRIVAGSTLPLNTQVRTQKILEMARFGQAFGLVPGTMASMQLGKDLMEENEMLEVSLAYDKDVENMLKPKEPTPQEIMKMKQAQMSLMKGQKSIETADNRMQSNTQSTIKKAIDNAQRLDGNIDELDKAQKEQNLMKGSQDMMLKSRKNGK